MRWMPARGASTRRFCTSELNSRLTARPKPTRSGAPAAMTSHVLLRLLWKSTETSKARPPQPHGQGGGLGA